MNKDEIENLDNQINEMRKMLNEAKQKGINGPKITILKHNLKKSLKLKKEAEKNDN